MTTDLSILKFRLLNRGRERQQRRMSQYLQSRNHMRHTVISPGLAKLAFEDALDLCQSSRRPFVWRWRRARDRNDVTKYSERCKGSSCHKGTV